MQSHLKNFTTQRYILIFPMELMYTAVLTQQHWKNYGKKTKAAIRINCNANYRAHSMSLPHCPFISEQNILLIPHSLDLLEWLKRTEDDVICKS
jgi:hypothetical protein